MPIPVPHSKVIEDKMEFLRHLSCIDPLEVAADIDLLKKLLFILQIYIAQAILEEAQIEHQSTVNYR